MPKEKQESFNRPREAAAIAAQKLAIARSLKKEGILLGHLLSIFLLGLIRI